MYRAIVGSVLLIACLVNAGQHDIYKGYSVHGVKLRDQSHIEYLYNLENEFDLDFWQHGYPGDKDALIMLTPDNRNKVLEQLDAEDLTHYLHVADVSKNFEEFDGRLSRWRQMRRSSGRLVPFEDYPRHDEVNEYLERIAEEYPDNVTIVNAGQSYLGRDIKYLKISTSNFTDTSKPIYFMDAMIHAREWVTTPVTLYAIHRLVVELLDEDRDLLETIDWIILPIVNPDGYEYTHDEVRLWRKTRSSNPIAPDCPGVDANRNFDINFNTTGVSTNPCDLVFPGYEPFSEPETRIIRDIIHDNVDRMQIYINIHSFGNWLLFGYGNRTLPGNPWELFHVGAAMGAAIDALKLPEAAFYMVGNSAQLLYFTSGSAQDYAQAVGVPLSYTLELPGYGVQFQVPPEYIEAINKETWSGIAVSARFARAYYAANNPV